MVLMGEAIIAFVDKDPVYLCEGDFIHIPAHVRHKVQWTVPERDTVWLAVHY